ncbi:MAG: DUF898 domain-containing protein [Alphaproteobacteria bacterium]|nr:DUF898 domain-containing protein [Alphaproteobacteria bacterium]
MNTDTTIEPWGPQGGEPPNGSTQPPQATQPPGGSQLQMSWLAPIGMIGLSITNFIFRILTLGIYDFWARTEVRKRLWSSVRLHGEPLVYTGTGKELFLGFLIVFGLILLPMLIITTSLMIALGPDTAAAGAVQLVLYVVIFFLFGIAVYRAQRYRLLRTTWRGIRGSMEGSSMTYAITYFLTMLLIPFTAGWIIPWRSTKLQSIITNDARFGDRPFSFKGGSGPLYGPFAVLWFGAMIISGIAFSAIGLIVTYMQQAYGADARSIDGQWNPEVAGVVGVTSMLIVAIAYLLYLLLSAWYRSRTINHFAQCTHFENANFNGRVTGAGLLWIDLTNLLIQIVGALFVILCVVAIFLMLSIIFAGIIGFPTDAALNPQHAAVFTSVAAPIFLLIVALSFTFLLPVTQARSMGYLINHLDLEGTIPLDQIAQSAAADVNVGEGLAQAFDVDAF